MPRKFIAAEGFEQAFGKENTMRKILTLTAASLLLASNLAFAQETPTDPAATDKQDSISDNKLMQPFFTDDTMSTMRTSDEIKAAWAAMTEPDRASVKEQCKQPDSIKLKEFCGTVENM